MSKTVMICGACNVEMHEYQFGYCCPVCLKAVPKEQGDPRRGHFDLPADDFAAMLEAPVVHVVDQDHLLRKPNAGAGVATAQSEHHCPVCYQKEREARHVPGYMYPARSRWQADKQEPCVTCKRNTFWCSEGPWTDGVQSRFVKAPE